MRYIKTYESHSIKIKEITKYKLEELLNNLNLVTLPYFNKESDIINHISKNFNKNDGAILFNPSIELTGFKQTDERTAFLYTKRYTYVIMDISENEVQSYL